LELLPRSGIEDVAQSVTRLVNSFYRCRAVYQLHIHKRPTGQFYSNWEIKLYENNEPKWLVGHKKKLVKHIQDNFGCKWVKDIKVVGS